MLWTTYYKAKNDYTRVDSTCRSYSEQAAGRDDDDRRLPVAERRAEAAWVDGAQGFPESYDRAALLKFVMDVKSGVEAVTAPTYSHLVYDIVPDEVKTVTSPDILIVEGLNVLQPARRRPDGPLALVSDFFDFSIYVDADEDVLRDWYLTRFMRLRETAFRDPRSYFRRFTDLTEDEAVATASQIWDTINGPNLVGQHPAHPRAGDRDPAQGRRPRRALMIRRV